MSITPIELEMIISQAMKMAHSNSRGNKYDGTVTGAATLALITGALTSSDVKAALLEWRPTQKP